MRLTSRGRYAVTAMLDLALHYHGGVVALSDIAERQHISLSYLEQLFAQLRREGLVVSTRGPRGGYHLSRSPHAISVAQIIDAIDEHIDATKCGGDRDCQAERTCLTHDLWVKLSDRIRSFLSQVTLGKLLSRPHVQGVASRQERDVRVRIPH